MYEEALRKVLNNLLGEYVPNKADMDNLSSYLYKVVVSVFKDADMKKEYKSIKGITKLDEDGFKKAVKDISLFTSQKLLIETLNHTYKEIKNIVPTVKASDVEVVQQNVIKKKTVQVNNDVAEAEFDIDLKSVPKVDIKKEQKEGNKKNVKSEKKMSSEFVSNVEMNLEEINKNVIKSNTSGDGGNDGDLTLGAGILGEGGGYSSVPNIDISLDY